MVLWNGFGDVSRSVWYSWGTHCTDANRYTLGCINGITGIDFPTPILTLDDFIDVRVGFYWGIDCFQALLEISNNLFPRCKSPGVIRWKMMRINDWKGIHPVGRIGAKPIPTIVPG